jgi:hypothetical protein
MTDSQGKNGFADTNGGKELCLETRGFHEMPVSTHDFPSSPPKSGLLRKVTLESLLKDISSIPNYRPIAS